MDDIDLPDIDLPDIDLPDIDLPDIDLPDVDLSDVDLSDVDITFDDETGATAIEYALIASLISIVIIAAAIAVGGSLIDLFQTVVDAFPA